MSDEIWLDVDCFVVQIGDSVCVKLSRTGKVGPYSILRMAGLHEKQALRCTLSFLSIFLITAVHSPAQMHPYPTLLDYGIRVLGACVDDT